MADCLRGKGEALRDLGRKQEPEGGQGRFWGTIKFIGVELSAVM